MYRMVKHTCTAKRSTGWENPQAQQNKVQRVKTQRYSKAKVQNAKTHRHSKLQYRWKHTYTNEQSTEWKNTHVQQSKLQNEKTHRHRNSKSKYRMRKHTGTAQHSIE